MIMRISQFFAGVLSNSSWDSSVFPNLMYKFWHLSYLLLLSIGEDTNT